MINSDAHRPEQLDGYYNETASILREIGFRELTHIGREGRHQVPL
jgi:histidinol phosphatase-like PHP family hydrolase